MKPDGFVYFIQVGADGPIKIGHSENPRKRLSMLQGSHFERLHLLGLTPGNRLTEERIQQALSAHRLAREWFRPDPAVIAAIEQPLTGEVARLDLALEAREHLRLAISVLRGATNGDVPLDDLRLARDLLSEAVA